ncbi:DUF6147 family protein [Bariatricus sp. HCP28S3_C2]|uniref:DUF6147 family protein n=1 Tax=unclassified Bariatricus TaxID=2677046 RepID=UPI003F8BA641
MKRSKSLLLVLVLTLGMLVVPSKEVKAAELGECIDGSYLIEDDSSEGEDVKITRGMYLKSGTSSIAEVGTGKIAASGKTVGQIVVSKISVVVRVEKLVNGSWQAYTTWSATEYNSAYVSASKTLSVPIGYYYRVYSTHTANSDVSGSYTNGIHI